MKIGSRHLEKRALQGLKNKCQFAVAGSKGHCKSEKVGSFCLGKIHGFAFPLPCTFQKLPQKLSGSCHLVKKEVPEKVNACSNFNTNAE